MTVELRSELLRLDGTDMNDDEPTIEIRRARVADLPLIGDFVSETYGPEAPFKQEGRLRWQFLHTPYRKPDEDAPSIFVAISDEKIVGTIGVQDGLAYVGGDEIPMGWVVDVIVHPAFRGRGLGHRIHARALLDRPTLITLTMAEATRRIAERAGCITLGPTREFVRPVRISARTVHRFLASKAPNGTMRRGPIRLFNATRIGPLLLAAGSRLIALTRRPTTVALGSFEIEEVRRFPSATDELFDRVSSSIPATFERSAEFLNWRFGEVPDLSYRRFLLRSGGDLRGYVITRAPTRAELPAGTVVDLLAAPGDPAALDALLAHAAEVLTPQSEYLQAAASTAPYRNALQRAGYFATRTMRPTIVSEDEELLRRLDGHGDDWHFTMADHDWDQLHPA